MTLSPPTRRQRQRRLLPGLPLALGITIFYLALVVLIPLSTLFVQSAHIGPAQLVAMLREPEVAAAFQLTFKAAFIAAAVNTVFGLLIAWVLTRYSFLGRRLIDGLVDLPFALPTAVAGIALMTLFADNGWLGPFLARFGIRIALEQAGVVVALIFIGIPFVVRTVQPVLNDLDPEIEEAAASLGASRGETFWRVIFPALQPALLTGFALAFARGIGEYGSVVFISGNQPLKTEIVPQIIYAKLDQFDYPGATAVAVVLLLTSFALLLTINGLQWWMARRTGVVKGA